MPDAATVSLGEAIDHLRSNFSQLIDDFVNGRLAIWAGSGISRERFPNLSVLLKNLLDGLQSEIDQNDPVRRTHAAWNS